MNEINIEVLKKELYSKYRAEYIANQLGISKSHLFKILNEKANMTVEQYNLLQKIKKGEVLKHDI